MKKLNVGIVGLGWAAGGHLLAFNKNPDCQVVALCSRKSLTREEISEMCQSDATLYHSYDEFLNHPGLDIVDICTPHSLHAEQAIKAAEKQKHLMIEKPLSLDFESLIRMRDAIEKAKVRSIVYFELRFLPEFDLLDSCIRRELLGKMHYLEVDYYHGIGPWYGQYEWNIKKKWGYALDSGMHLTPVHATSGVLGLVHAHA